MIKDPRIVLLKRLYFSLLPDVKIVCLTRAREAASNSMKNLDQKGVGASRFLPVWDFYTLECQRLRSELGDRVHSIQFEDFLADPIAKIKGIVLFFICAFCTGKRRCRARIYRPRASEVR